MADENRKASGMKMPPVLDALDDEAKAVCCGWFAMMKPREGRLSFAMKQQRPTRRAQEALDRLVTAGVIEREGDVQGPHSYTPLVECRALLAWLLESDDERFSFPLTEKVTEDASPGFTMSFARTGDKASDSVLSETLDILRDEYGAR